MPKRPRSPAPPPDQVLLSFSDKIWSDWRGVPKSWAICAAQRLTARVWLLASRAAWLDLAISILRANFELKARCESELILSSRMGVNKVA